MSQKLVAPSLIFVAFLILFISIFKASSVKYVFSQAPSPTPSSPLALVNYPLPELSITPENPLWPAQAIIDRIQPTFAGGDLSRASLYLHDADSRLVAGRSMYERGKIEESFVVLQKSEGYLMQSYEMAYLSQNPEEKEVFLLKLSMAALKHREILETILATSPEDGRAVISRLLDTPKSVFDKTSADIRGYGLIPPVNPF